MISKRNKTYNKIRKSVKEGEIFIIPSDNRLLEMGEPPYVNGGKRISSWFRSSPKSGVRRCIGIKDFLDLGVTIPAWTTFKFYPNEYENNFNADLAQYSIPTIPFAIQGFPFSSTGDCPMSSVREIKEAYYPKLVTPYAFITAPGWSTMIVGMLHSPSPNYDVVPGIVHTDFYHQINVVLNIRSKEEFYIPHNEPLVQLIPFKRSGDFSKIKFEDEDKFKYTYGNHGDSDVLDFMESGDIARGYRKSKRSN